MPPDPGPRRLEALVTGRVQGVGFRWFVVSIAESLGLTGWVSNERDGSVRVVAEGPPSDLDQLVERLRVGPAGADVADIRAETAPASGEFRSFGIRAGAHSGD